VSDKKELTVVTLQIEPFGAFVGHKRQKTIWEENMIDKVFCYACKNLHGIVCSVPVVSPKDTWREPAGAKAEILEWPDKKNTNNDCPDFERKGVK